VTTIRIKRGSVQRGGVKGARAHLNAVAKRLGNLTPGFEAAHKQFIDDEVRLFESEGATGAHGPWPPNKPATVTRKGHARILRGMPSKGFQLRASCVDPTHPEHVFRVTGRLVQMGTSHWKAAVHAEGRGGLPRRRPVDPTRAQRQRYSHLIGRFWATGKVA